MGDAAFAIALVAMVVFFVASSDAVKTAALAVAAFGAAVEVVLTVVVLVQRSRRAGGR